jgi:hypothetical protein
MRPTTKEMNAWITTLSLLVIYGGIVSGAVWDSGLPSFYYRSALYLVVGVIVAVGAMRLFQRPEKEDERDRLIALRAQRNAYFVAMSGIGLVILTIVLGPAIALLLPGVKANTLALLVLTMVGAELTNQVSRIVDYRRLA